MSSTEQLSPDEASRLAVTAAADDLEHWARSVATDGQIQLADLYDVLDVFRGDSAPQHSTAPSFPTLAAS